MNLSEEQVKAIGDLSEESYSLISGQEEEIGGVDVKINEEFDKHVMDQAAIAKLVDQKFVLENKKMKSLMSAYVKLKTLVNEEQIARAKNVWLHHLGIQR